MMPGLLNATRMIKRGEYERRREESRKWCIKKIDGVEYIVVDCETCGQPWPRQRVIRFREDDFRKWIAIVDEQKAPWRDPFYKLKILSEVAVELAAFCGVGFLAYKASQSGAVGIFVGIGVAVLRWISEFRKDNRRMRKFDERKREILASYGGVSSEQVGTMSEYRKPFVILPRE